MSDGHWFVTRRVVKKAIQWNGNNEYEIADFMPADKFSISDSGAKLFIETLEGCMEANVLDWIIRGVNGEFYPCKPDIFATTYEPFEKVTAGEPSSAPPAALGNCDKCGNELFDGQYSKICHKESCIGEFVESRAAQEVSPPSRDELLQEIINDPGTQLFGLPLSEVYRRVRDADRR